MAAEKRQRWLKAADGLYVLSALYPDDAIAGEVRSVLKGGNLLSIRLDEVAHGAGINEAWRTAMPEVYAHALESAENLVRTAHQVSSPRLQVLHVRTG